MSSEDDPMDPTDDHHDERDDSVDKIDKVDDSVEQYDESVEDSIEELEEPIDEFDQEASACSYTNYVEGEAPGEFPETGDGATGLEADVWDRLYEIEDPEMPVSIVDLGLIYGVEVDEDAGQASILMTLTYTGCPARDYLKSDIRDAAAGVDGIESVDLELVWSPPWNMDMVTEQGKADLREFGLSV